LVQTSAYELKTLESIADKLARKRVQPRYLNIVKMIVGGITELDRY